MKMNRRAAALKLWTTLVILAAATACVDKSAGLGGAAVPRSAATGADSSAGNPPAADESAAGAPAELQDSQGDSQGAPAVESSADEATSSDASSADDAPAGEAVADVASDAGDAPTDGAVTAAAADGAGAQPDAAASAAPHSYPIKCPPRCPITLLPKSIKPFPGKVVFVSDRGGSRQLYIGNASAPNDPPNAVPGSAHQDTRSPVWSPDGKLIAYLTSDIIVGNGASNKVATITVIDGAGTPQAWFHSTDIGLGTQQLDYLTWSNNGDKLCFSHYLDWSARGLSCLEFPTYKLGGPYNLNQFQVRRIVEIGGVAKDGAVIAPSECAFAAGDGTLYFSADIAATRGRLYSIAVPKNSAKISGKPTTVANSVKDDHNAPIDLVFSPSFGVQNGKPSLLLNRECAANPANGCLDEELFRYDFTNRVMTRLTGVAGNQYGSYGRGAGGAYVMQTSETATGPADLVFVTAADQGSTATFGDTGNAWNDFAPDWWVK